jgi:FtsZ-binding cell division protein ZapB
MSTDDTPDLAGSNQRLTEIVARLYTRISELEIENNALRSEREYWQRQAVRHD